MRHLILLTLVLALGCRYHAAATVPDVSVCVEGGVGRNAFTSPVPRCVEGGSLRDVWHVARKVGPIGIGVAALIAALQDDEPSAPSRRPCKHKHDCERD